MFAMRNPFRTVTLVVIAIILLMLSGCATKERDRVVTQTKFEVIGPEEKYFSLTRVPAPPARHVYEGDTKPDFEDLYKKQVISTIDVYGALNMCNADKGAAWADFLKKRKAYE